MALDTSGPSLTAALRERPDVVKPNAEELAQAVGRPLTTVGDAVEAAEELRSWGARAVLASLGADGQLLVDADGARFGSAPVAAVRSNVGAGTPRSPVSHRGRHRRPGAGRGGGARRGRRATARQPDADPRGPGPGTGRAERRSAARPAADGAGPRSARTPSPPPARRYRAQGSPR
ncbi:PfkB family carbohydrate kinase [Streptomyces albulus]|nr:PfkB family carbohydrate kinase [Streptomyces noursei]